MKLKKMLYSEDGRYKVVMKIEPAKSQGIAGEPRELRLRLYERRRFFWKRVWEDLYDAARTSPFDAATDAVHQYEESIKEKLEENRRIREQLKDFKAWDGTIVPRRKK